MSSILPTGGGAHLAIERNPSKSGRIAQFYADFKTFWTAVISVRLRIYPFVNSPVLPYLYAGAGWFSFDVKKPPTDKFIFGNSKEEYRNLSWNENNPVGSPLKDGPHFSGNSFNFPLGIGVQIPLSENFTIDANGGPNPTLSDDLNPAQDGIKDAWWNFGLGLTFRFGSSNRDSDEDGLLDRDEEKLGTNPDNPDTDGDGLKDGEEVTTFSTNPLNADTDGDGLQDGQEVKAIRTDPLKADTDGDGLRDGEEVNQYKTDPLKMDTDGDSLSDGDEVKIHKTNPLEIDTDRDGLTDGDEVRTHRTNPLKPDTDNDGLGDKDEVSGTMTNPNNPDTDGDGLKDGEEVQRYKTDPKVPDTDKGSVNDGAEVTRKTDPLDPNDDIPRFKTEVGKKILLEGIVFKTGSAEILPESEEILTKAYNTLRDNPEIVVEIHGHTDNVGRRASNMKLSKARAESVKAWLVGKGIDAKRIGTRGFGPDKPTAPNTTEEGKQQNRRIEFMRVK